eukprot:CAMPEP_0117494900 /NCGR_PEP_ID=MMETSP0784-20121206/19852_1 /TAXON_ID=39447 /ORGANISM="" /LENGTH=87 /DNA_ID=CAMNT_0005289799 /DNA_START=163 /DNA_END=426 /DNA_ORIENTATION=-
MTLMYTVSPSQMGSPPAAFFLAAQSATRAPAPGTRVAERNEAQRGTKAKPVVHEAIAATPRTSARKGRKAIRAPAVMRFRWHIGVGA